RCPGLASVLPPPLLPLLPAPPLKSLPTAERSRPVKEVCSSPTRSSRRPKTPTGMASPVSPSTSPPTMVPFPIRFPWSPTPKAWLVPFYSCRTPSPLSLSPPVPPVSRTSPSSSTPWPPAAIISPVPPECNCPSLGACGETPAPKASASRRSHNTALTVCLKAYPDTDLNCTTGCEALAVSSPRPCNRRQCGRGRPRPRHRSPRIQCH